MQNMSYENLNGEKLASSASSNNESDPIEVNKIWTWPIFIVQWTLFTFIYVRIVRFRFASDF
jgi:hypothetical protein